METTKRILAKEKDANPIESYGRKLADRAMELERYSMPGYRDYLEVFFDSWEELNNCLEYIREVWDCTDFDDDKNGRSPRETITAAFDQRICELVEEAETS